MYYIYIYVVHMTDMTCKVRSTVVAANLSAAKQRKIDAKHSRGLAHTLSYFATLYLCCMAMYTHLYWCNI